MPTAQAPFTDTIPAPRDIPYPGTLDVRVDATDVTRGIFRVTQTIPVAASARAADGRLVLLFPKWLPGNHAPRGEVEKLAGLRFTVPGNPAPLAWRRDLQDMHAFHVDVPAGATAVQADFAFLSATAENQGRIVATQDMLNIQPNSVSLYPAGHYTRRIPVRFTVKYPAGWQAATALRGTRDGDTVAYNLTDYETLVDSPIFAGRWFRAFDLGSGVTLNVVADAEKLLAATPDQIAAHRRLVEQGLKLFGGPRFDRYDFLLALTDQMGGIGLEHHRSSENGVNPAYFTEWSKGPGRRNLLPHEFTHSWNGKYRRPADLWTPDFRQPMRDSLMWVYEGQTQFWGYVLGARSGLFTKQETLDALALIAANLQARAGREWRPLQDTTNDPIISARAPKGWTSYQRSEDYYNEGMMIWLEADAIIRRESRGARGLDDFARAFFAGRDGDWGVKTYDFDDVVATLNAVQPYNWRAFLRARLDSTDTRRPVTDFGLAGYQLTYASEPTPFHADQMRTSKTLDLQFSGGLVVGEQGRLTQVIWGSEAFDAGLTVGDQIVAVNDRPYAEDTLRAAVATRKTFTLWLRYGDRVRELTLAVPQGLRYPRLVRAGGGPSSLDLLLSPK